MVTVAAPTMVAAPPVDPMSMLVRIVLDWILLAACNAQRISIIYSYLQMALPGLFIKQKIELLEIMTGFETENKFVCMRCTLFSQVT